MLNKKKIGLIILIAIVFLSTSYYYLNQNTQNVDFEGNENRADYTIDPKSLNEVGKVEKTIFNSKRKINKRICIISGMHPREDLSKNVLPKVAKDIADKNPNVEIILYKITVYRNHWDFNEGRSHGEALVNEYVVKDLKNYKCDVVIIAHDHKPGYGEGYYLATPFKDFTSQNIAEYVQNDIGFGYYSFTGNSVATSINKVDIPIIETGNPVLVYEIPQEDKYSTAYKNSFKLMKSLIAI